MTTRSSRSLLVGLTGPIGAGKSYVASIWREKGAGIVEGDEMGRLALQTSDGLREQLVHRFGSEILQPDGTINRSELAHRAFADSDSQLDLTRLTFPVLYDLALKQMKSLSSEYAIIVFDAALIYEWGVEKDFDLIVAVISQPGKLSKWASARLKITESEVLERLSRQIDPEVKAAQADIVIRNDATLDALRAEGNRVWDILISEQKKKGAC